jgi:5-methylcytosine-specific restriction endonuclease McrA
MKLTTAYRHWQGECAYCGVKVEMPAAEETDAGSNAQAATRDHFIPRAAGGRSVPTNMVLACRACNGKKADLDPRKVVRVWARIDPRSLADVIRGVLEERPDAPSLAGAMALLDATNDDEPPSRAAL